MVKYMHIFCYSVY